MVSRSVSSISPFDQKIKVRLCKHQQIKTTSTLQQLANMRLSFKNKMKSMLAICAGATGLYAGVCIVRGNETFYKYTVMPFIQLLDPESAHKLAVYIAEHRLMPKSRFQDTEVLKINVLGKQFSNPIGIAAGFDKDGKAVMGLKDLGFGFVEVGSVTPLPQAGNEKPRVFRLPEDKAVINRYGFNSEGHSQVLQRIENVRNEKDPPIIGVNLGKNKLSEDAIKDYVEGVKRFGLIADYLVVNISSPNTPNLRALQNKNNLRELLKSVLEARNSLKIDPKPPLLLKLAPDLSYEEKKDIADVVKEKNCKVDGLIVCNTTIQRPELKSKYSSETGGLSGEPLNKLSTNMIREMSKLTNGILIIGVGGVTSGQDAYEKIKAGASLVQIYSSMVYEGPLVANKIKSELISLLKQDGYHNVSEAVGKDVR